MGQAQRLVRFCFSLGHLLDVGACQGESLAIGALQGQGLAAGTPQGQGLAAETPWAHEKTPYCPSHHLQPTGPIVFFSCWELSSEK